MDEKREKDTEKKPDEGGFDFKKFGKMAEMMKGCCAGEGMPDCCSMMRKMMKGAEGKEKEKE